MAHHMLTIKFRNSLGNALLGVCLIAMSTARWFCPDGWLMFGAAASLLMCAALTLYMCLSPRREVPDEMSVAHNGTAASHALWVTLIAIGIVCVVDLVSDSKVDYSVAGLGIIGLGLLTYGVVFAWLEQ